MVQTRIIIVGGGFAGVITALKLARRNRRREYKITLISDKTNFEYLPGLYRVVTGRSPAAAAVPLRDIFKNKPVELLTDSIKSVNLSDKQLVGQSGSRYHFDYLILALGSETAFFDIPGLPELSFSFKSMNEAIRLREHLEKIFQTAGQLPTPVEKVSAAQLVVVGGGPSGVELAAELGLYAKTLAKKYQVDPSFITIDLLEAAPRLLPALPPVADRIAQARLRFLGVNIFLNRQVIKEEINEIFLKDMEMKTKTVIWTAGVKPHHLYREIAGLEYDPKGRVKVDAFLRPPAFPNVFILGDGAATPYSGMAQTAIIDGQSTAKNLSGFGYKYHPQKPVYAIPLGPGAAIVFWGPLRFGGYLGFILRRLADFKFFLKILPWWKALKIMFV